MVKTMLGIVESIKSTYFTEVKTMENRFNFMSVGMKTVNDADDLCWKVMEAARSVLLRAKYFDTTLCAARVVKAMKGYINELEPNEVVIIDFSKFDWNERPDFINTAPGYHIQAIAGATENSTPVVMENHRYFALHQRWNGCFELHFMSGDMIPEIFPGAKVAISFDPDIR